MDNRSKPSIATKGPIKRVMIEEAKAAVLVVIVCSLVLAWSHFR